jgi:site-specific DNA recombinase
MRVVHASKTYYCKDCKRKISVEAMDEIYQQYLHEYLQTMDTKHFLDESLELLKRKEELLIHTQGERNKLSKKVHNFLDMTVEGELSKEQFTEYYKPLSARLQELDATLPELQAEVDFLGIQLASSDTVFSETQTLSSQWDEMEFDRRRTTVETITDSIVIRKEDIDITLCFLPSSFRDEKLVRRNFRDS